MKTKYNIKDLNIKEELVFDIKITLPKEKAMYDVFKDLEKHGRTIFSFSDRSKQQGLARSIGIRGKKLVDKGLLIPPLSSTNKHRMTGVQLPIGVSIKEKKKGHFFLGWK